MILGDSLAAETLMLLIVHAKRSSYARSISCVSNKLFHRTPTVLSEHCQWTEMYREL